MAIGSYYLTSLVTNYNWIAIKRIHGAMTTYHNGWNEFMGLSLKHVYVYTHIQSCVCDGRGW